MLQPTDDKVLIKKVLEPTTTEAGLIIAVDTKPKPTEGIVTAIGQGASYVSVGDRVVFGKFLGHEIDIDGEAHLFLHEFEIAAVLGK